ncbi:hypothetical protein V5O48_010467 [Marasmius crinis-equi]|uniref:Uncharacterized protein n=1 Tax=Marasmius crinis-equi TaxID=585013 RepID=A0ABR3F8C4_9AGAR
MAKNAKHHDKVRNPYAAGRDTRQDANVFRSSHCPGSRPKRDVEALARNSSKVDADKINQLLSDVSSLVRRNKATEEGMADLRERMTALEKKMGDVLASRPPTPFDHFTKKGRKKIGELFPEIAQLPVPQVVQGFDWNEKKAVTILQSSECSTVGWERQLAERARRKLEPDEDRVCDPDDIPFFPSRLVSFGNRHAVVLGVKTQTNSEHEFALSSSLDALLGQEKELLVVREDEEGEILYGGRYKFFRLKDENPAGYVFDGAEANITKIRALVTSSQIGEPKLSSAEISAFIRSGQIGFQFFGLKLVDYNRKLYRRLAKATERDGNNVDSETKKTSKLSISLTTSTNTSKRGHHEFDSSSEGGGSISDARSKRARHTSALISSHWFVQNNVVGTGLLKDEEPAGLAKCTVVLSVADAPKYGVANSNFKY